MIESNERKMIADRLHGPAATFFCLMHILTVCGMAYQSPWKIDHFALVNFTIWLSPALLPLIAMRSSFWSIIIAIPITLIFCARSYFVWQLYSMGTNSVGQKGDPAWLATTVLGAISIGLATLWLLLRAASSIVEAVQKSRRKSSKVIK